LTAVFAIASAIAAIWSMVKYQIVYNSLIGSFPPQFQDPLTSRYAFPVLALSPSTPLSLQADYVKSLWGFCVLSLYFAVFFLLPASDHWLSLFGFLRCERCFNDQVLEGLQRKLQSADDP
jgi:hypothetical protein